MYINTGADMKKRHSGGGLLEFGGKVLNRAIDLLPIELHIPGYQYCGPGTKLQARLSRGDPGVNKLDEACKQHDIAYTQSGDSKRRAEADRILAERAWQRVNASDSSAAEKAAAWTVTNLMKVKSKFGGSHGSRRRKQRRRHRRPAVVVGGRKQSGKGLYLRQLKGRGLQIRKKKTSPRCRRAR